MLNRFTFIISLLFSLSCPAGPNTELEKALWEKNLAGVRAALQNRADPLLLDANRHNWIHVAVIVDFAEAIDVLADAGTPVNGRDDLQQTPAHLAANEGQVNILQILERRGANLFVRDNAGHQPIDLARQWRHTNAVAMLQAREIAAAEQRVEAPLPRPARRSFFCCFGAGSQNTN
jgi:ankyrin repeat protein